MTSDRPSPPLTDRELSWLEFNDRVLALAQRLDVPPLERLKFIAIASSNLDEFYMVRIGGLERSHIQDTGETKRRRLLGIGERARSLGLKIARTFESEVVPALDERGVRFIRPDQVDTELAARVSQYYQREVHPCLTPIAIDTAHPFPLLRSGTLNLALRVRVETSAAEGFDRPSELLALVQVPSVLPRFVNFPTDDEPYRFMALEDIIRRFAGQLFPGHTILEASLFRVTRSSDLEIAEEEAEDLLSTIEDELRRRDRGDPVRLEMSESTSWLLAEQLRDLVGLEDRQLLRCPGFIDLAKLWTVYKQVENPELRDPPFTPSPVARLRYAPTIFRTIREGDILLYHPYDSFRHVVDFMDQAAADPDVVAIKQTLYRTSGDSPVVKALARAAEQGKEVTALVELKARFDEANNIAWARALERSGVHVVYGLIGLKTHSKVLLITRREDGGLRRYLHLATGNYNPSTARLYTDLGMFTANEDLTHDAMLLFNVLTGYGELPEMRKLVVAPFQLRQHIRDRIEIEIAHAQAGRPSGLVAKMNSLVDEEIIRDLYRASQAGVPVDLIIRGICCLQPGIPKVSENIRVRSILGRFLEHARIFWWRNGGDDVVYSGSADWMPRNLDRRIEVVFPIEDEEAKRRVMDEVLGTEFRDNTLSWDLMPNGTYVRRYPGDEPPVDVQATLIARADERGQRKRTAMRPEVSARRFTNPAERMTSAQARRQEPTAVKRSGPATADDHQ